MWGRDGHVSRRELTWTPYILYCAYLIRPRHRHSKVLGAIDGQSRDELEDELNRVQAACPKVPAPQRLVRVRHASFAGCAVQCVLELISLSFRISAASCSRPALARASNLPRDAARCRCADAPVRVLPDLVICFSNPARGPKNGATSKPWGANVRAARGCALLRAAGIRGSPRRESECRVDMRDLAPRPLPSSRNTGRQGGRERAGLSSSSSSSASSTATANSNLEHAVTLAVFAEQAAKVKDRSRT